MLIQTSAVTASILGIKEIDVNYGLSEIQNAIKRIKYPNGSRCSYSNVQILNPDEMQQELDNYGIKLGKIYPI